MRIKKKHIQAMLFYIIILIVSLSIYRIEGLYAEPKVLITNVLIIVLSLIFMIAGDRYNYSLNKIFMLFSFFFFGIAPAIQYQRGITLWTNQSFTSEDYFKMNVLIISILVIYQLLYTLFSKTKSTKLENQFVKINNKGRKFSNIKLLLVSVFSLFVSFYIYNFSIVNLLVRSRGSIISNQSISLIYANFIRPLPAIALYFYKKNGMPKRYVEIVLWGILLLTNFPTAAPRFYIAALYIPVMIIYIKKIEKRYLLFNKIMMLGLLIVFPMLDQARRISSLRDVTFSLDFRMFSQGHFDSYQMFMHVVSQNIVTYGKQLLSALLFFVPRSIWHEKSVGSGTLVANQYDFIFSNVSMNYFGEGYINFGFLGVLLFVILISYFNARYDRMYWRKLNDFGPLKIFYIQSLGLQFFYLRGDMLSGTAFVTGMFVSLLCAYKLSMVKS